MGIIRELWREFTVAFRAGRQGGEAQREFLDELEIQRLGASWGKAKTPAEREAAGTAAMRYAIYGPEGGSDGGHLADENQLEWSDSPGAHEAYLIKRHNNPYFAESRRIISRGELSEAKNMDEQEFRSAQQRLISLVNEVQELPSLGSVGELQEIREKIDELIRFSVRVGGPAKDIALKSDHIRDAIIRSMREAFSDDPDTLETIERADTYDKDHVRKFYIPMVAQIIEENSIIPREELVSAIMSEDPMTISIVLDLLPEEGRSIMQLAAMQLVQQVLNGGYIDPQLDEKLAVLTDGAIS